MVGVSALKSNRQAVSSDIVTRAASTVSCPDQSRKPAAHLCEHARAQASCGFHPLSIEPVDECYELPLAPRRRVRRRRLVPVAVERHASKVTVEDVSHDVTHSPCARNRRLLPRRGREVAQEREEITRDGSKVRARIGRRQ
jgi:hypothetical protein